MNVSYATLDETRAAMTSTIATADNDKLRPYPGIASKRIDSLLGSRSRPYFAPYYEARKIRVTNDKVNSYDGTLALGQSLLELVSVTAGTTALVVGTNVELFPDSSMPPFSMLRLTGTCPYDWWYYAGCTGCGNTPYFVTVTGWWGYSSDYDNAWLEVDILSAAIVNTTTRTFTTADVDGTNIYGISPRLSPLAIIRIDDEVMIVTLTDKETNTVTVAKRGDLGSTAATHLISAPVYVWQVEADIKQAVAKQSGLLFTRRGAYTTVEVNQMSETRYPVDLLQELKNVVWGYANG